MTALEDLRALVATETDDCIRWGRSLAGNGYGMVRAGRMRGAHVVVCEWVHGPKPAGMEVAHSCGVRCCVNPRHLRWATHVDNVADRLLHGTQYQGDLHAWSVLTEAVVPIVRLRAAAGETYTALGREYGLSRVSISNAVNRRTWRHVA